MERLNDLKSVNDTSAGKLFQISLFATRAVLSSYINLKTIRINVKILPLDALFWVVRANGWVKNDLDQHIGLFNCYGNCGNWGHACTVFAQCTSSITDGQMDGRISCSKQTTKRFQHYEYKKRQNKNSSINGTSPLHVVQNSTTICSRPEAAGGIMSSTCNSHVPSKCADRK